ASTGRTCRRSEIGNGRRATPRRLSHESAVADIVLVFNAGSTSLKFAAYAIDEARALSRKVSGGVEAIQCSPRFAAHDAEGRVIAKHGWTAGRPIGHDQALHF